MRPFPLVDNTARSSSFTALDLVTEISPRDGQRMTDGPTLATKALCDPRGRPATTESENEVHIFELTGEENITLRTSSSSPIVY